MNRSASVGNGPIGLLAEDMAQDYYAYHWPYPLITLAAGNCEQGEDLLVDCSQTPSDTNVTNRSYNTLVVGASNSNNTAQISDDFLARFSQYTNPATTHNDFELPNLVAPGADGYTQGVGSASAIGEGTSASAPIVLGTALLMKTRDNAFYYWPEMTRATILAASTHPIDGPRTDRLGTGVDRKHGAGLLNSAVAVSLANPSNWISGPNNSGTSQGRTVRYYDFATDFPTNNISAPYNIVAWNTGRLRVVAAWDATAQGCDPARLDGSGCQSDAIDGDLDLRVSRYSNGSWQLIASSSSWDSSWEMCDIAVTAGEIYKAELVKYATNTAGTYVGIAWNNYDPNQE